MDRAALRTALDELNARLGPRPPKRSRRLRRKRRQWSRAHVTGIAKLITADPEEMARFLGWLRDAARS